MPNMKSLGLLFSAWLAIGAFLVPVAYAETLLDAVRKDSRYQALTTDQQKQVEDKVFEQMVDQFLLFTNCQPLGVIVRENKEGDTLGLTKADIQAAVESRLRSARLYTPKFAIPHLDIGLVIIGDAFSITMHLIKRLSDDTYSRMYGLAVTWRNGYTGTHGGGFTGGNLILSSLSQLLDRFIADYLRVNEVACVKKKGESSDEMRQRPQASPGPRDSSEVE